MSIIICGNNLGKMQKYHSEVRRWTNRLQNHFEGESGQFGEKKVGKEKTEGSESFQMTVSVL